MPTIYQRGDKFQAKVRKAGHNVSKTFLTKEAAADWANRFEVGLSRYKHNVSNNHRMTELAPLLGFIPLRVLSALSRVPYTLNDILEAAVDADKMVGIYFLINKGDVVYVGQSKTDVLGRIAKHKRNGKVFEKYTYMRCEIDKVDELEAMYIEAFLPKSNSSLSRTVPKL